MKQYIILSLLLFSLNLFGSVIQTDTSDIHSNILNENRRIYIFHPEGLDKTDSVIFLYLLDGEFAGFRYREALKNYPGKMIVGIGIVNTNRNRDLLPVHHPGEFMAFIRDELMPEVEKNYMVKKRVLFGHSFAGGFVIHSMLESPGLFDTYIASSPTPIMDIVHPDVYSQLDGALQQKITFFFSYGSEDMKQVRKWASRLKENLEGTALKKVSWKSLVLENRNHDNAGLPALIRGLEM